MIGYQLNGYVCCECYRKRLQPGQQKLAQAIKQNKEEQELKQCDYCNALILITVEREN